MTEQRKNRRMPVIKQFDEPVMLNINDEKIPGIILDISADGMQLMTYASIPVGSKFRMAVDTKFLQLKPFTAKVVWAKAKGDMYQMGMHIDDMDTLDSKRISRMALEYNDCENKILLGAPDVCNAKCSFHSLCEKKQKI